MAPVRYRWDAKARKVIDMGLPPMSAMVLSEYAPVAADEVDALAKGLVQALKGLRMSEPGRMLADLMWDADYRVEFDEGMSEGQRDGMIAAFTLWRDDYVTVGTYMLKALAVLFGDPEAADLVTATMVYELAARPILEAVLEEKLPPAWNHPNVKKLMKAVRANAPEQPVGEPPQQEFRRFARSVFSVFAFLDILRTGVHDPRHGVFLLGFSESTISDVGVYAREWLESLTTRATMVTELMLRLNGEPGDQGATLGYWMGATIVNTLRAGVEETLRFASPLG